MGAQPGSAAAGWPELPEVAHDAERPARNAAECKDMVGGPHRAFAHHVGAVRRCQRDLVRVNAIQNTPLGCLRRRRQREQAARCAHGRHGRRSCGTCSTFPRGIQAYALAGWRWSETVMDIVVRAGVEEQRCDNECHDEQKIGRHAHEAQRRETWRCGMPLAIPLALAQRDDDDGEAKARRWPPPQQRRGYRAVR